MSSKLLQRRNAEHLYGKGGVKVMTDIFGTEPRPKAGQICIGDDLYNFSVTELSERIAQLHSEISRTEAALTKKRAELSEAETLFAPRGNKQG